jgi:hypothetical protein
MWVLGAEINPLAQVPIALLAYEPERAWFNGRIAASQAADVGSIPIARSRTSSD